MGTQIMPYIISSLYVMIHFHVGIFFTVTKVQFWMNRIAFDMESGGYKFGVEKVYL